MFLFRRKKDNTEAKLAAEEAKVKKALEQKEKEDKARAKKESVAAKVVKVEAIKTSTGKEAPVKVVIPASSLKQEGQPLKAGKSLLPATAEVPDDLVDSLLVKVTREGPDESKAPALPDIVPSVVPVQKAAPAEGAAPVTAASPAVPVASGAGQPVVAVGAAQQATNPLGAVPVATAQPAIAQPAPVAEAAKTEAKPATPPKASADGKKGGEEDKGNMFSSLFGKTEVEEETYLDRLIKSLPDITIEEVISEAEEVKGLMNEWAQKPDSIANR